VRRLWWTPDKPPPAQSWAGISNRNRPGPEVIRAVLMFHIHSSKKKPKTRLWVALAATESSQNNWKNQITDHRTVNSYPFLHENRRLSEGLWNVWDPGIVFARIVPKIRNRRFYIVNYYWLSPGEQSGCLKKKPQMTAHNADPEVRHSR
jgi:hypothetical protein